MIKTRQSLAPILVRLVTGCCCAFAAFIVWDTIRTIIRLHSPLPWFDEWATVSLFNDWWTGERPLLEILFSQHNEHRILIPRLLFFIDDLIFKGQGDLSLAAIILVQAAHAALFLLALARGGARGPGAWAIGAVIVALMFTLQQEENFASGFQVQFFGVFAAATLCFMLLAQALARRAEARPWGWSLIAAHAAALAATLTMANGIASAFVLVLLEAAGRLPRAIIAASLCFALLLAAGYFYDYEPVAAHSSPGFVLTHPMDAGLYAAAYLGNVLSLSSIASAAMLGFCGIAATAAAGIRILKAPNRRPIELALLGVMLFVGATVAITTSGRLGFGVGQALSSRYVSGSVAFWAAQLTYWWITPPLRRHGWAARAAVAITAGLLLFAMGGAQSRQKAPLVAQAFAETEAADLLVMGLIDANTILATAWSVEDVQRLSPFLKERGISVFSSPSAAIFGHPVGTQGEVMDAQACAGGINAATSDPALGTDGLRLQGRALSRQTGHPLRRILIADQRGIVLGFGSGGIPGAEPQLWRGFATAPAGAPVTAYAVLPQRRLCRLGTAIPVP